MLPIEGAVWVESVDWVCDYSPNKPGSPRDSKKYPQALEAVYTINKSYAIERAVVENSSSPGRTEVQNQKTATKARTAMTSRVRSSPKMLWGGHLRQVLEAWITTWVKLHKYLTLAYMPWHIGHPCFIHVSWFRHAQNHCMINVENETWWSTWEAATIQTLSSEIDVFTIRSSCFENI